ncbi:response regulator transcription factor [Sulfurimonas sp.]|uniref:response regulator transcription factor n=1 Tax=Sulfurimonas sp. TaxID=2022749 RepID=UPI0025E6D992|nr:response regulator transcription factor [Sulfurimonas sp.]
MNILMAEDYIILHNNLKKILSSLFDNVDASVDGKEALELYNNKHEQNESYDIVLSDIAMPYVDGVELTRIIKKINPSQEIIILSAHKEVDYLLEFINLGVRRFIPKPVVLEYFLDELYLACSDIYTQSELLNIIHLSNNIFYNKGEKFLYMDGMPIILSAYERLIIEKLILKLNLSVSTDEIVSHLYNCDKDVNPENIRKLMYRLRQKLPKDFIQSMHGVGYRLVQQVENKSI